MTKTILMSPKSFMAGLVILSVVVFGLFTVTWAEQPKADVVIENVENLTINVSNGQVSGGESGELTFGASGTRFPNGVSADSTSPSAGQVRGTTQTITATSTLYVLSLDSGTVSTGSPTSTQGLFVGATDGTATTTVGIGEGGGVVGCLEMVTSAGTYSRAIIDGTTWNIQAGRCDET